MNDDVAIADKLRATLSTLLASGPASRLLLAPGVAIALGFIFNQLRVKRVALAPCEYLRPGHFPGRIVEHLELQAEPSRSKCRRFDAIIASPVGWDGSVLPVPRVFRAIRAECGQDRPILIADCSHLGAIGFPSPRSLGADIVIGEIGKWLLSPKSDSGLTFIWCSTERVWGASAAALQLCYLARAGRQGDRMVRWLQLSSLDRCLREIRLLTRARLLERHRANLDLASRIMREVPGAEWENAAIVRVPSGATGPLLSRLRQAGLSWTYTTRDERILCRADCLLKRDGHRRR